MAHQVAGGPNARNELRDHDWHDARHLRVRSGPDAPSEARRFVRQVLAGADPVLGAGAAVPEDLVAHAELLVSELVTGASRHDGSRWLEVVIEPGARLRVAISDDGGDEPHERAVELGRVAGQGLVLLDQLAADWGTMPRPGGFAVWFELGDL